MLTLAKAEADAGRTPDLERIYERATWASDAVRTKLLAAQQSAAAQAAEKAAKERAERARRSEEHTSELQSLMRISYAVFCLKKKKNYHQNTYTSIERSR